MSMNVWGREKKQTAQEESNLKEQKEKQGDGTRKRRGKKMATD